MSAVTLTCLLFELVGVMFMGISIPLIRGKVAPNHFYGFRTAKSLSDPRIWYEINRLSGGDLLLAGVLITASGSTMSLLGQRLSEQQVAMTLFAVMVLSLVGVAVHSLILLRRM
jgi:uncharacterized membrane protein